MANAGMFDLQQRLRTLATIDPAWRFWGRYASVCTSEMIRREPLAMWVCDVKTLRILDANDAALALYGYERTEFVGRQATDLQGVDGDGGGPTPPVGGYAALPVRTMRRQRRKGGALIEVHILAHPVVFAYRPAVLAVAQATTASPTAPQAVPAQPPATDIQTLIALSNELEAAGTAEEVHQLLVTHAMAAAGAAHAALALTHEDGRALTVVARAGAPLPRLESIVHAAESRLGRVVATGHAFVRPTREHDSRGERVDDPVYEGLCPLAILPVGPHGTAVGALVVACPADGTVSALSARVLETLEGIAGMGAAAIRRMRLRQRLQDAYARTILELAQAIEMHGGDPESRAARLIQLAAAAAGVLGCGPEDIEDVRWAAKMYDIGLAAAPDDFAAGDVPAEPGPTARVQSPVADEVRRSMARLRRAATLVRHHQERWDGAGYPDQLRGSEIPLGARILAVLEAYGTMCELHPSRPVGPRDEAAELRRGAGTRFDPAVVDAFCAALIGPD